MNRLVSNAAFSVLSKRLPGAGAIGAWLKGTGLKLLESAYSQQNEFAADELGTKLAIAGGYESQAGEKLLQRLARTQGDNASGLGQKQGSVYCSNPQTDRNNTLKAPSP